MDYFIAGDSHGPAMVGILTGFPAGFKVDLQKITHDLYLRRAVYGRGKRMKLENDSFEIISGIYDGLTTGAPLTFCIPNYAKNTEKTPRSIPRPGHGDYSAYKKYKIKDFNLYTERNSARWTSALTVIGSISRQLLNYFQIGIIAYTKRIGSISFDLKFDDLLKLEELRNTSKVLCPDKETSKLMISEIDAAIDEGNTLGGEIKVLSTPLIAGLGSYDRIENKLDSKLASLLMSIPSVKGIIIGEKIYSGREYNDPFAIDSGNIYRTSNNCGGIEGGFTNGNGLDIELYVKPIPTLKNPLQSVDIETLKPVKTPYIRSDYTSVPSVAIISQSAVSFVILNAIIERYGNGNVEDIKVRIENDS